MARRAFLIIVLAFAAFAFACAPPRVDDAAPDDGAKGGSDANELPVGLTERPLAVYHSVGGVVLGEPRAIAIDFSGNPLVADGVPGRVIRLLLSRQEALEFDTPAGSPGFYPSDLTLSGFFTYVIDEVGRKLVRFDRNGAYLDVLIRFDHPVEGRRLSPLGLDVDGTGRIAISDVESHRIVIFDSYLAVEIAFGTYGSHPGQFRGPQGVSFTDKGDLLVADSGNARVQLFDERAAFVRSFPREDGDSPLVRPRRAVMDKEGSVYVADPSAGRVFVFDNDGELTRSIVPEGVGSFQPTDIEVTTTGLVYVTDVATNSLYVFR